MPCEENRVEKYQNTKQERTQKRRELLGAAMACRGLLCAAVGNHGLL